MTNTTPYRVFRSATIFTAVVGVCWALAGMVAIGASFLSVPAGAILPPVLLLAASVFATFAAVRMADNHRSGGLLITALAYIAITYFTTPGPFTRDPGSVFLVIVPGVLALVMLIEAGYLLWRLPRRTAPAPHVPI